jgi:hypothetical protein
MLGASTDGFRAVDVPLTGFNAGGSRCESLLQCSPMDLRNSRTSLKALFDGGVF